MHITDLDPGVAAATIDEAIDATLRAGVPAAVADGFSPQWAVVDHYLAKVLSDAEPLAPVAPATPEECEAVVDRFLAGLDGMAHARDRQTLVDAVGFVAASSAVTRCAGAPP